MRVVAAMSGGVDSSVVAALLVEQGHDVIGVHMKLHDAPTHPSTADPRMAKRCCGLDDALDARQVADRMGIDIFEVVDAAATKPFGFTPYYPGPGLGGHCIPIDPFYLTWKAREYGLHTRFIELSGEVNQAMPEYVLSKLMDGLNVRGKPLNGSKVLVLGIAYKKNVDDMRESPSVEIMELIEAKGGIVGYSDPHVPVFPKMREHHFDLSSEPLTVETLQAYDAVILATDHDKFDYELIRTHAKVIVDSRGKYRTPEAHIIKA